MEENRNRTKLNGITGCVSCIRGDVSGIRGYVNGIRGDVSGIRGDVSGITGHVSDIQGDVDLSELTDEERSDGININNLIMEQERTPESKPRRPRATKKKV